MPGDGVPTAATVAPSVPVTTSASSRSDSRTVAEHVAQRGVRGHGLLEPAVQGGQQLLRLLPRPKVTRLTVACSASRSGCTATATTAVATHGSQPAPRASSGGPHAGHDQDVDGRHRGGERERRAACG